MHWSTLFKYLWASPCSLLGLIVAAVPLVLGGKAAWAAGALEITYRENLSRCGKLAHRIPFRGIVFGHVILAVTKEELRRICPHERVHVEQYERWGLLFFVAYGASSIWQLLKGGRPYWDNYFEVQARCRSTAVH